MQTVRKMIKLIHEGKEHQVSAGLIEFSQLLTFAFGDEEVPVG